MNLVSISFKDKLYILRCGEIGFSCLGFSKCGQITAFLQQELGPEHGPYLNEYGTPKAYAEYQRLCKIGQEKNEQTGWRSEAELTPQLIGLEGCRVEVSDSYGNVRRFNVGKSTGWMPCHLELSHRYCRGGGSVTGAPFQKIRIFDFHRGKKFAKRGGGGRYVERSESITRW